MRDAGQSSHWYALLCGRPGESVQMQTLTSTLHIQGRQLPHYLLHKTNYRSALTHLSVPNLRTAPSPVVPHTSMKTHPGTNQSRNQ